MIILDTPGDTIQAEGSAATAITVTVYGIETDSNGDNSYKKLGQSQLTGAATQDTIYTLPASSSAVASVVVIANADSSDRTVKLWHVPNAGSPTDSNILIPTVTVTANKVAVWNKGEFSIFPPAAGGTGDVTGPASSTDEAIARFDGTGGKTLQNSSATLDDNGTISIPADQKLNFEGAAGDTYLTFNSTANKVEIFVNGTKKAEW